MQETTPKSYAVFWRKAGEKLLWFAGILSCFAWLGAIAYWWYFQVFLHHPDSGTLTLPTNDQPILRKITITIVCVVLCLPAFRVLFRKLAKH